MNGIRIAWRGWRRRPLPPILVVLLLAIGIAPNVAVFTAVNHLLLSPLAVDRPETLVSLGSLTYPDYESFAERLDGVTGVAAFVDMPLAPVHGTFVTANYFALLGITAIRGRTFDSTAPSATRTRPSSVNAIGGPHTGRIRRSSAARYGSTTWP